MDVYSVNKSWTGLSVEGICVCVCGEEGDYVGMNRGGNKQECAVA